MYQLLRKITSYINHRMYIFLASRGSAYIDWRLEDYNVCVRPYMNLQTLKFFVNYFYIDDGHKSPDCCSRRFIDDEHKLKIYLFMMKRLNAYREFVIVDGIEHYLQQIDLLDIPKTEKLPIPPNILIHLISYTKNVSDIEMYLTKYRDQYANILSYILPEIYEIMRNLQQTDKFRTYLTDPTSPHKKLAADTVLKYFDEISNSYNEYEMFMVDEEIQFHKDKIIDILIWLCNNETSYVPATYNKKYSSIKL